MLAETVSIYTFSGELEVVSYNIPIFSSVDSSGSGYKNKETRRQVLRTRRRMVVSEQGVRDIPELNISDLVIDTYMKKKQRTYLCLTMPLLHLRRGGSSKSTLIFAEFVCNIFGTLNPNFWSIF